MKKITSIFLAFIFTIFLLPLNVFAVDNTPKFIFDNVSVFLDEEVDIKVKMKNNPGISSFKLIVNFDSDLSLTGVTYNDSELGGMHVNFDSSYFPKKEKVALVWINGTQNTYGDIEIFTLKFKVSSEANIGTHNLGITYDPEDVYNIDEKNIEFAIEGGKIEVNKYINVENVIVDPNEVTIKINEKKQLTGTVLPENAINKSVNWTSSDETVVTVDENGLIKGLKKGTAVVTVTTVEGEKTDSCNVTVICEHSFGEWTKNSDKTTHSRTCSICGDVETENHTWNAGVVTTEPTCLEKGIKTYTCTKCGGTKTEEIAALGHSWGEVIYTWSEDGKLCTASRTCTIDHTHTESENAVITSEVTINATCEGKGTTTYTATFTNTAFATQTKSVEDIAATGHNYVFDSFVWSEDGKTAQAKYICSHDNTHVVLYNATVTSEVKVAATCEGKGTTTYTATYDNYVDTKDVVDIDALGHNYTAVVTEPTCTEQGYTTHTCTRCNESYKDTYVDALGHSWGEVTYTWSEDLKTCTANRTCTRDHNHKESETADISSKVTMEATCISKGITTYTATFTNTAFATQTKAIETDINPDNHKNTHVVGYIANTYLSDGYTGDKVCLDCQKVLEKGEVIPSTYEISENEDGTLNILKCREEISSLVITEYIEGRKIKTIGANAFEGQTHLKTVELSGTVETIGKESFKGCTSLESIKIGETVISIGDGTFSGCDNLKIYGKEDSYAHNYATGNNIDFVIIEKKTVTSTNEEVKVEGDNYSITEGTVLVVEEKEESREEEIKESLEVNNVKSFEIKLTKDDETVQPSGEIEVRIKLPDGYDPGKTKIYYIDESGNKVNMEARYEDGYMVFTTTHFSEYALVEENHILGDINKDGVVNNHDLFALMRFLVKVAQANEINEKALDVNGDKGINNKDLVRLFQYTSGYNVVLN